MSGSVGGSSDAILIQTQRAIVSSGSTGTIIPDCAIEEVGRDDLQITEHPVEQGSTISDHAFKKPREVTLRWSWSNSGHFSETFVKDVYAQLLDLQAQRNPFTIYTGKSAYANMLIASLSQTTNEGSEYTLNVVAVCREVIIVTTSVVSGNSDKATQAVPSKTTGVVNKGTQNLSSQSAGGQGAGLDMNALSQLAAPGGEL